MMYNDENIAVVTCPYNPEHIVRSYRFPRHLVKCKKNYPHIQLEPCFYNYCHHVKNEEMSDHFKECPEKRRIECNRYRSSSTDFEKIKNMGSSGLADELLELHISLAERKNKNPETLTSYFDQQSNVKKSYGDISKTRQRPSTNNGEQVRSLVEEEFEENELQPLSLPKTKSKSLQIKELLFY